MTAADAVTPAPRRKNARLLIRFISMLLEITPQIDFSFVICDDQPPINRRKYDNPVHTRSKAS